MVTVVWKRDKIGLEWRPGWCRLKWFRRSNFTSSLPTWKCGRAPSHGQIEGPDTFSLKVTSKVFGDILHDKVMDRVLLNPVPSSIECNHAETPVFVCYWAFVPSFLRWRSILGCLLAWWSGPCPTHPQLSQPGERQTNFGPGLWMRGRFHCSPFGRSQVLSSQRCWHQLTGRCAH